MRLPFVSRARLELALHNLEKMRQAEHRAQDALTASLAEKDWLSEKVDEAAARYDALLDKYHALRVSGADPAPAYQHPTTEQFGPLTRAAIADMGVGQSGPIKRAMKAKAEFIWAQNRGEQQDELTAIAVRQGETHSP